MSGKQQALEDTCELGVVMETTLLESSSDRRPWELRLRAYYPGKSSEGGREGAAPSLLSPLQPQHWGRCQGLLGLLR